MHLSIAQEVLNHSRVKFRLSCFYVLIACAFHQIDLQAKDKHIKEQEQQLKEREESITKLEADKTTMMAQHKQALARVNARVAAQQVLPMLLLSLDVLGIHSLWFYSPYIFLVYVAYGFTLLTCFGFT